MRVAWRGPRPPYVLVGGRTGARRGNASGGPVFRGARITNFCQTVTYFTPPIPRSPPRRSGGQSPASPHGVGDARSGYEPVNQQRRVGAFTRSAPCLICALG
jgi:hypothetical protein